MEHPPIGSTDEAAAASAVCAAKSAGWEALRRLNHHRPASTKARTETRSQMLEADVMAEEFRATYHPTAVKAFGTGDRFIGQPFEMYVVDADGPRRVWAEQKAVA